ncbi:hydroxylysine kinase /5-phosphonooxy-L-lysine phospho-lyase [Rhodoglobus vestalii]|uniref:Hydroxylysine kinase /5-phosphonooxy-L-lysine phospho-lyase n=1 Tax=Rhodoglobus vestalii TaxID=193384 RepID=A0A8H2K6B8_9MICO|nr:aminotransferase [Rhodoglobus vestalii]TQO18812.1 hydroxylysine kinase /5-phosphonooxy-L-lysine phospho-lyase [Rhodoglobus vestalii]
MNDRSSSVDFLLVQDPPPEISEEDAAAFADTLFGIDATARSLGSHQDRNFLLEGSGERALLKISNPATTMAELEAQSRAAIHLAEREPRIRVPLTRTARDGGRAQKLTVGGQTLHARVLDFLDGAPLSGGRYLSPHAVRAIGALAARVALAFADFAAPGIERSNQWDLRRAPEVLDALLPQVSDEALRARLREASDDAWAQVSSLSGALPVQTIHGDLTDDNVVSNDTITGIPDGIIDFGDLNRSWAVGEIAITVSSLLHHDGATLPSVLRAAAAYHAIRPLSLAEAEALWPLVVLRGSILVASGHHVQTTDPDNEYASENLLHELRIFEQATSVPLAVANELVRTSLGHEVQQASLPASPSLMPTLNPNDVTVLDFSATSAALDNGRWLENDAEAEIAVEALRAGASAALTRFAEPRLTRARIPIDPEPQNTPLGIELTLAKPHELIAPWPGTVTLNSDGIAFRGNGVLLSLERADALVSDGSEVTTGAPFARVQHRLRVRASLGDVEVPWLVGPELAAAWRTIACDPTPLVLGHTLPSTDRDSAALIVRRRGTLADAQEFYYDEPPMMVRGWKEYLVDTDARVYLDVLNNVTSLGHAHPRLVNAVTRQWSLLNTNSRFNYPEVVDFSERLSALLPDPLSSVFLVNSGSEAVDLALRIARAWKGRSDVLAVREAYHGWTYLSDAVSTSIADNPDALSSRPDWVHAVDAPNTYRGKYRGTESTRYADEAVAEVERLAAAGTPVGAFIAEAFYGNAGGVALPDGYLDAVYRAVRKTGGLAIADEVQVGYGRLGEWFWGFEQQGVVPDLVAVAKAMGNGHPLGAVITTPEIAANYRSQGYFFSSAGGSPVSSVVGLTVLDVMRDERLQENAVETGSYLKERLATLGTRHPLVGTVHGSGFYLGLELVRDRVTLEPATAETYAICERLREVGVIVQPTSDYQCVLKIKPPMCLTRASADAFVDALDRVLTTGW